MLQTIPKIGYDLRTYIILPTQKIIGMRSIKIFYVQLVFSVILCVSFIIFVKMSSKEISIKNIKMHPFFFKWATSPTVSNTNSTEPNSFNTSKNFSSSYSDSHWDALVESDELTGTQIMEYFMWTNRSSCVLAHDFGGKMLHNPSGKDGQKVVCIDTQVAPQSGNCLVYSFGISNEWSFDEEMEQYGCQVFAFDPSMGQDPHDHTPGIHFYNWGLSDRDGIETHDVKWEMYSLSSIYNILSKHHGPNKVIDYLKMDIEGSEWKVISNLIKTGMLSKVRQIGLELHLPNYPVDGFRELIRLVRVLERSGFVRFDSKYNPWYIRNFTGLQLLSQPAGYEIAWYNIQLV